MDLFNTPSVGSSSHVAPLAERVRPQTLDEVIGQTHLIFPDSPFLRSVQSNRIPSMILWGPPGIGKTTLARIVANSTQRPFRQLSAVSSGVKEVREVLRFAEGRPGTILFIDEIHRFNKAQQDSLLGSVERGRITLIGATTENPSFEVNAALLSRSQVFVLKPLDFDEVRKLLEYAIKKDEILSERDIELKELDAIYRIAGGDARKSLTLLEIFVNTHKEDEKVVVLNDTLMAAAQEHVALYDKSGEQHYDIISAFIKSVRGGDPNAAVYYLAQMLNGGEDVKFIARRLIILASEDIGNANPNALLLANACFQSVNVIGLPEARIILSQTTTYLATSEKSNAAYAAINAAMKFVKENPPFSVPLHLRNAPTKMMKSMDYGKGYKYSHDFYGEQNHQEFLPDEIVGTTFYQPKPVGAEVKIRNFLDRQWGEKYKK